jgi:hypothetical protein
VRFTDILCRMGGYYRAGVHYSLFSIAKLTKISLLCESVAGFFIALTLARSVTSQQQPIFKNFPHFVRIK